MRAINKDIEKYLSQVKSYLHCKKADKTTILADISTAVFEFAEDSETVNIEDIYNRFGTPEEIAKAYLSDAEPNNIKKAINIRKVIIAAVAIALAMLAITFAIALFDSHRQNVAYYYNSDVVIDVSIASSAEPTQMVHISPTDLSK
ncbi:MAG: hypothetical protein IJO14_05145 [Clostridia bacterium]|nr:hypothetical protein [Clostridia bacterium]